MGKFKAMIYALSLTRKIIIHLWDTRKSDVGFLKEIIPMWKGLVISSYYNKLYYYVDFEA